MGDARRRKDFCFHRFRRLKDHRLLCVLLWIGKELDRKLIVICDVFSVLTAFKPDITKSSKPARLALIQRNILDQKLINMTIRHSAIKHLSILSQFN